VGVETPLSRCAADVNAEEPGRVARRVVDELIARYPLEGRPRVLLLGMTYKPDVADTRGASGIALLTDLTRRGVDVSFHDPYVSSVSAGGAACYRIDLTAAALGSAHGVVIVVAHRAYDFAWITAHAK